MQRKGVTLNLLWLEYVEKCRLSGDVPYQSTQFNKYYGEYVAKHSATMHLNHKSGEIMQVDWAGDTAEVIDNISYVFKRVGLVVLMRHRIQHEAAEFVDILLRLKISF